MELPESLRKALGSALEWGKAHRKTLFELAVGFALGVVFTTYFVR